MSHIKMVDIVNPEAPVQPLGSANTANARRRILPGALRIGVLDNSKANADHLLELLVSGLRAEYPSASVCSLRKQNPSFPATESAMNQLVSEAEFAFTAMAD